MRPLKPPGFRSRRCRRRTWRSCAAPSRSSGDTRRGSRNPRSRFAAPDIEFEEDPSFPEAGTFRGRDAYLRYARDFIAQFEQFVFSVEELIDAGPDKVLVCLHLTGRGKESGAAFDFRPAWLYTVCDGRVVKIRAYLDRGEALEAAGLRE